MLPKIYFICLSDMLQTDFILHSIREWIHIVSVLFQFCCLGTVRTLHVHFSNTAFGLSVRGVYVQRVIDGLRKEMRKVPSPQPLQSPPVHPLVCPYVLVTL